MSVIPVELESFNNSFWMNHSPQFDLSTNEGCGQYTEAWVSGARGAGFIKVGHLKKYGSATQYNGHANDAFLYNEPDPDLLRAVDIIFAAEAKPPYNPSNPAPNINFGVDIPRYTIADWTAEPGTNPTPIVTVPWVAYDENSFQRLKKQLAYDYGRRPQNADYDVTVWAARVFHSQYFGPSAVPLGFDAAMQKHRPEWCDALGVPVDNHWE